MIRTNKRCSSCCRRVCLCVCYAMELCQNDTSEHQNLHWLR